MSRAPAPMKIDATAPATVDAHSMNPYGMQTFSMMPGAVNSLSDSPLNTMQNMYSNIQLQQQQQQQHQHQMQQHQMHQHQAQMSSQMPSQMPPSNPYMNAQNTCQNVSVVDFKPDIMAQHHIAQMQQKYQQQMANMNNTQAPMGLYGCDGQFIPATAATPYDTNSQTHPYGEYGEFAKTTSNMHNFMNHETPVNTPYARNAMPYKKPMAMGDGMGHEQTKQFARSMHDMARKTSEKAFNNLVDKRIETHASAVSATKSLIDERVHAIIPTYSTLQNARRDTTSAATAIESDFSTKTHAERHAIVSNAVRSVMGDLDTCTDSPYSSTSRNSNGRTVSPRERMMASRYARRD